MSELSKEQIAAVKKMHNGCILCGGVGSGKSRTSLAYYFKLCGGYLEPHAPMTKPKDLYIITTAKKRDSGEWEEECAVMHIFAELYNIKITIDSWNNINKYKKVKKAFFIFDEQRLVGYGSWSKAFLIITKANEWILASATPGDDWPDYMVVFIANGFYKNKTDFCEQHIIYDYRVKFPKIRGYVNTNRLIRLRDSLLVNIDVVRLTVPHDISVETTYDRASYKQLMKIRWDFDKSKPIESASELCYALRKIVNTSPSRQNALLDICEEHKKVIVFYNFDYELNILRLISPFPTAEWNGHKHEPLPTGDSWMYLVQYTAGCEGWNCITTDTIIFYSQNYSYKVLEQAKGRINRMNTPFVDLYYYHLKSAAPIDLAIGKALKEKRIFNEGMFAHKQ